MALKWIIQILGLLGTAACLACFYGKKMKHVLLIKLSADVFWGAHYFLLGAWAGGITNAICLCRELVFLNKEKKLFGSKAWPFVFIGLNWVMAILTWQGWYSILPAACSTAATYGFYQHSLKRARFLALGNNVIMFTYDLFVGSRAGLLNEGLAFVSVCGALILAALEEKKARASAEGKNEQETEEAK